ncbi:hypothetical protein SO802_018123 [Lithocarpus litseifolius]|uniref:Uncharacterized protein n=1 Tax=Lithocarpus litseifolius TaxID=425828 RepID=A0AAW2CPR8_9ROSI
MAVMLIVSAFLVVHRTATSKSNLAVMGGTGKYVNATMPVLRPFQLQVENVLSSLCILLTSVYRFKGGYILMKIVGVLILYKYKIIVFSGFYTLREVRLLMGFINVVEGFIIVNSWICVDCLFA